MSNPVRGITRITLCGRITALLLSMLMFVTLMIGTTTEVRASDSSQAGLPTALKNIESQQGTRSTYIEAVEDGYMRVLYYGGKVCIEYYDSTFELTEKKILDMELPVWGGFFKGRDAYYLVEGRNNTNCVDGTEVVRIIKYDYSWQRVGAGKVLAQEGWEYEIRYPFYFSCVNMTESGGKLYLITGREGYVDPQLGQGHQGMMLIRMDESSFSTEIVYGDFGHSFSQYLTCRGSDIYIYEESEGGRCTMLSRFDANSSGTDHFDALKDRIPVLEYGGERTSVWAIPTYASANDIAMSSDSIIGIGSSIDQSGYDTYDDETTPFNIYVTVTPVSGLSAESTEVKWITNHQNDPTLITGVSMTKINDNRFLVTWDEYNSNTDEMHCTDPSDLLSQYTLHYIFIDGDGNKISKEYTAKAAYSDCHPVLCGDKVVFCASSDSNVDFYAIDSNTGSFSKKVYSVLGENATWNYQNGVLTVSGSGELYGDNDWSAIGDSIKKAVVKGTITVIPERAFTSIEGLQEVVIEDGVTEIGEEAFAFNANLEKITIPASVIKIGKDILWNGWCWIGDGSHVVQASIYAPSGSYAAEYAQKNGIDYVGNTPGIKISGAVVSKIPDQSFTGKSIMPLPKVKYGTKTLKLERDFELSYKNNKKVGIATVVIKGIGSYSGKINVEFRIIPKKPNISTVTAGKKSLTVKWKKPAVKADVCQIEYATDAKFSKGRKSVLIKNGKTTSKTIKGLKAKKKYYVRMRMCKKVSGKKYWSKWSKTKSRKTL